MRLFNVFKEISRMFLIAGLGNVGKKYEQTKHNFGFLLADEIAKKFSFDQKSNKFNAEFFTGTIEDHKIILIKPQTFMNLSGSAVLAFASFYKIPPTHIIVLHDDLDLELGRIKSKTGGGNAGHNGLKDIDAKVGKNYVRIRLGIGRPENAEYEISDYVLSKFGNDDLKIVEEVNNKITKNLQTVLEGNLEEFMTKFSSR
ncbi:MAG: PTH1 family peptidyl-tRNA hydrolase [Myxococcota bacterium]|jgi:PTH1 family peptidyl-tRNA hydrolase